MSINTCVEALRRHAQGGWVVKLGSMIKHVFNAVRAAEEAVGSCNATLDQLRMRRADAYKAASMDQARLRCPYH